MGYDLKILAQNIIAQKENVRRSEFRKSSVFEDIPYLTSSSYFEASNRCLAEKRNMW